MRFPSIATGPADAGPEIKATLYRPAGEGPFPAIVLAHTCAGVNAHTQLWAKRLTDWGYVVVAPDSFNPRGVSNVCSRGNAVTGNQRVADMMGALEFLATLPFVRRDRIGLIGHSHGGWTAMRSAQKIYRLPAHGLRAIVAYYPLCQAAFDTEVDVPLLILIGDRDDWTAASSCRRLQAAGFTRPELVQAVYYPDAYHSFDMPAPPRTYEGHRLVYDSDAAKDAEARTRAFFAKYLTPP
ncbi:MAG TPA: dienelactone hydrolase family protein [Reyranella sp.]|nr:dienelactone hydrolase family protein [Reyranella sp.]